MSRPPRLLLSQSYYHIMTRGNNRNVVFKCDADYQYFLELILRYKTEHPFDLYHYCLMPNHVHLLVQTNKATDFSTFMKKLNLAYFHHYRQEYGWVGHFWQDRFKSQAVGKDAYFIQCGKYIELNPLRAERVAKPENYRWSSYGYYLNGEKNLLLTEDFIYTELSPSARIRQIEYEKMVIDKEVEDGYGKEAWGSDYQRYQENRKTKYHFRKKRD